MADEGRSYFTRQSDPYRIIQMSLVDTFAATGAGAFTLSENALYTVEAWRTFFDRLTPDGVFTVSRWFSPAEPTEIGRIISVAVAALLDSGVEEPSRHIALIGVDNLATLLLSKNPLQAEQLATLRRITDELQFKRLVMPDDPGDPGSVLYRLAHARSREELEMIAASTVLNVSPPDDESPYFFNMVRLKYLRAVLKSPAGVASGNLVAISFNLVLLSILVVLSFGVILLPLIIRHRHTFAGLARGEGFAAGAFYFALIGAGFMLMEVGLMQRMSIFLGHPVYALTVLLMTVTLSSGCGSLLTRFFPRRRAWFLAYPVVIATSMVLTRFLLGYVTAAAMGEEQQVKILITVAIVFPMGMMMGTCFPLGMHLVRLHNEVQTPWYWALNGIFGVIASICATFISIFFGISTTFYVAAFCYLGLLACNLKLTRLQPQ